MPEAVVQAVTGADREWGQGLWFAVPAGHWDEALPVGNGRLGAMVFGGCPVERVQFNEQTLWTGADGTQQWLDASRTDERTRDGAIGAYQPFGDLLLRFPDAHHASTGYRRELDLSSGVATTRYEVGGVTHTRRVFASRSADVVVVRLEMEGVAGASGVSVRVSLRDADRPPMPRAVTAARVGVGPGGAGGAAIVGAGHVGGAEGGTSGGAGGAAIVGAGRVGGAEGGTRGGTGGGAMVRGAGVGELWFAGAFTKPVSAPAGARQFNGMRYCAGARVVCEGGACRVEGEEVVVEGVGAVTLFLSAGTDYVADPDRKYRGEDPAPKVEALLGAAATTPFERLLEAHIREHRSLYGRVSLTLPRTPNADLPTDRRIMAYTTGATDPALEALVFQYGRYLMIGSSRLGGLPPNLQGLWNADPEPAWYCGYTNNINVQMNHWLAETVNLPECAEPLFDMIDRLAVEQARNPDPRLRTELGWICYSTNNPLGGSSGWGLHVPGSAWLVQHLFEAWAFGGDLAFLRARAYPHLRELTRMWDARLVENDAGELITPDGWSPEHGPVRGADGKLRIVEGDRTPQPGASYDQFIVHDLFTNFIEASEALGEDAELREHVRKRQARLLGPKVGRWGQLREWMEDVDDPSDKHRHISHMFAVHPGRQISPAATPELAAAAKVSLDARGDGACGWSRAWKLCHWARLGDGARAHKLVRSFLTYIPAGADHAETKRRGGGGVLPNLFCVHPPFQIDGNFGFTAGVAEMLVQSHERTADGTRIVHLLPALPTAWHSGEVLGLRARGGLTVDLSWSGGKLTRATIRSQPGGRIRVRQHHTPTDHNLAPGGTLTLQPQ